MYIEKYCYNNLFILFQKYLQVCNKGEGLEKDTRPANRYNVRNLLTEEINVILSKNNKIVKAIF
jgi:hypothetical protein